MTTITHTHLLLCKDMDYHDTHTQEIITRNKTNKNANKTDLNQTKEAEQKLNSVHR